MAGLLAGLLATLLLGRLFGTPAAIWVSILCVVLVPWAWQRARSARA